MIAYLLVQLGVIALFELYDQPITLSNLHLKGLSKTVAPILSYLVLFKIFWKVKISNKDELRSDFSFKILTFIIIISIGLELINQPLYDISKMVEFYKTGIPAIQNFHYSQNSIDLVYQFAAILIVSPILEELFFRKFLLSKLLIKYNISISVIISSLCFSLIHIETPNNLIPSLIFGILSSIIFLNTGKIIYSIVFHALRNSFYFIILLNAEIYDSWIYGFNFNYVYWSLVLIGLVLVFVGMKKITSANIGSSQITGIEEKV
ncbi:membrane protease YdiL (CAAX protease family) [Gramella sp. Hel_I_59]|nr:membrane protease YdiL (CAAX protease family) [Gramella sp. Hel_I_59]